MQKTIKLIVIVLATIGLTYGLVVYVGVQGFLFAWVLNCLLMMCVMLFTETLKPKFSSSYYAEKTWEKRGKLYEKLGIHLFRKLLVLLGWEKMNKKANPVQNSIQALTHLEYRTKQSELAHLIIFFIVLGFTLYVALTFTFQESCSLLILNIVINVYPVLLQRYNRPRLQRAIHLFQYKESRAQKITS